MNCTTNYWRWPSPIAVLLSARKKFDERKRRGIHTDGVCKDFDPHITLGEIDFDKPQADIAESQKNLTLIEGKGITISSIGIFLYKKEKDNKKAHVIEEVTIPFNQN